MDYALEFGKYSKKFVNDYDFKKNGQQGILYAPSAGYHAVTTYTGFFINRLQSKIS